MCTIYSSPIHSTAGCLATEGGTCQDGNAPNTRCRQTSAPFVRRGNLGPRVRAACNQPPSLWASPVHPPHLMPHPEPARLTWGACALLRPPSLTTTAILTAPPQGLLALGHLPARFLPPLQAQWSLYRGASSSLKVSRSTHSPLPSPPHYAVHPPASTSGTHGAALLKFQPPASLQPGFSPEPGKFWGWKPGLPGRWLRGHTGKARKGWGTGTFKPIHQWKEEGIILNSGLSLLPHAMVINTHLRRQDDLLTVPLDSARRV